MNKKRKKIPPKIADEIYFRADLLCCVCESKGDQIHHLDDDPSNNDFNNLVLLCFKHHDEASRTGGLSRKLSPGVLQRYRSVLYRKVEARRTLPEISQDNRGDKYPNEEQLFQLILDAIAVIEIQKTRYMHQGDEWEKTKDLIFQLGFYSDLSGIRARRAILEVLDYVAAGTRFQMPANIADEIGRVAYATLPIRNLRSRTNTEISASEVELLEYGISIGLSLTYDGALYLQNLQIVEIGSELLWRLLRYARINYLDDLQKRAMEEFDVAEDAARRAGDTDAVVLLRLYRKHGLSGDWHFPKYPTKIVKRLLEGMARKT